MISKFLTQLFGSSNQRLLKKMRGQVTAISALENHYSALSDNDLQAKTQEFRARLDRGEALDALLPEAFATVREAAKRTLGMRHFDVQLLGGMVLHQGRIAEMRTGEGKTLTSTLPVYLNALSGRGVHVVTVNEYLAKRDAEWMGKIYQFLGLSVGVIKAGEYGEAKRQAYACDITYGTNNEFGFDYLRDNMVFRAEDKTQRGLFFAIVDEVDSILIDEARTPLIISGPSSDSSEFYIKINTIIPKLQRQESEESAGDFFADEKHKQIYLSEAGHEKVEQLLQNLGLLPEGASLYDVQYLNLMQHVQACIRAHALYHRDVEYIVQNNQVLIVDEFTGRVLAGRRWSEGLHQAMEAKEGVPIQQENQTLASITFQNYFRLYQKLSGMTGTADTEAFEFKSIYSLETVIIPTHRAMIRKDAEDLVYLSAKDKYQAIIEEVKQAQARQQPVLIGTASIEASEILHEFLRKAGIRHEVLNAKQHAREAEIIAEAGRLGAVTIATNMAGRGTDIVLGGNLERRLQNLGENPTPEAIQVEKQAWQSEHDAVLAAGGLYVIGSERHESRRIDNQLRGRSGRQGDPGATRFYVSLEDNLMRIFGQERTINILKMAGMKEGEAIEHPWISGTIEKAQKKVEQHNYDIRKHLLEYDDVANEQRKEVYGLRDDLLTGEDFAERIALIMEEVLEQIIETHLPPGSFEEQWNVAALEAQLQQAFALDLPVKQWIAELPHSTVAPIQEKIIAAAKASYAEKEALIGSDGLRRFERAVMLQILDYHWKEHLAAMDYLRQGINLRGYAQKNPKQEYKREAFAMFGQMLETIKKDLTSALLRVQIEPKQELQLTPQAMPDLSKLKTQHASVAAFASAELAASAGNNRENADTQNVPVVETVKRDQPKVGRNDPCWCGSGKKFKHCHGKGE